MSLAFHNSDTSTEREGYLFALLFSIFFCLYCLPAIHVGTIRCFLSTQPACPLKCHQQRCRIIANSYTLRINLEGSHSQHKLINYTAHDVIVSKKVQKDTDFWRIFTSFVRSICRHRQNGQVMIGVKEESMTNAYEAKLQKLPNVWPQ